MRRPKLQPQLWRWTPLLAAMEAVSQLATPLRGFADRPPDNLFEGRIPARLNWLRRRPPENLVPASGLRASQAMRHQLPGRRIQAKYTAPPGGRHEWHPIRR